MDLNYESPVKCMRICGDTQVIGFESGYIEVRSVKTSEITHTFHLYESNAIHADDLIVPYDIKFDFDGKLFAILCYDNNPREKRIKKFREVIVICNMEDSSVKKMSWEPDHISQVDFINDHILAIDEDFDIGFQLYDFANNDFVNDDFDISKILQGVGIKYVYVPTYEEFVLVANGKLMRYYFTNNGKDLLVKDVTLYNNNKNYCYDMISNDEKVIITTSNGTVYIYDMETDDINTCLIEDYKITTNVESRISSDGSFVAIILDNATCIFRVEDNELTYVGDSLLKYPCDFAEDNKLIIADGDRIYAYWTPEEYDITDVL